MKRRRRKTEESRGEGNLVARGAGQRAAGRAVRGGRDGEGRGDEVGIGLRDSNHQVQCSK
eukprot:SAG31_NODE_107_length_24865_cov_17.973593_6_plen_60_part_00